MSNYTFQSPVYGLACDRDGCDATFKPQSKFAQCGESGWAARSDAKAAGWQVRPPRGARRQVGAGPLPGPPCRTGGECR
jgi:hypothetical protein